MGILIYCQYSLLGDLGVCPNSVQVFQVGSNFQVQMTSEASLHMESKVMKLESLAFGSAFRGITDQEGQGTGVEW